MADRGVATRTPRRAGAGEGGLRRDIGRIGLLFASVGSIVGSGWLLAALYAAQLAGPAALLAWLIGGGMILVIAVAYAELGAMLPVSGGVVRYPDYAFGSLVSFTSGWVIWLAGVTSGPIEVEAALQYATNYLPWLTHQQAGTAVLTVPGYGVAAGLMLLFSAINVAGVRAFARTNTPVVWWKLAVPSLTIVALLVLAFHGGHLTGAGGFAPQGAHGVFAAVATGGIAFSYFGFRQAVELAGESKNPHRNVPFAVIGSVLIAIVLYVLLQLAFLGAVPSRALADGWARLGFANDFGPVAGVAALAGIGWLAILLYVDAVVSPANTGLIYVTITARLSYAMARNRNAPSGLARLNGRGAPWVGVLLAFVVGLVVFLPFPSWQKLVGFITSATVLSYGFGTLALATLRRQLPARHRPYRAPLGQLWALVAFFFANLMVYWAGWSVDAKLFAAIGIGYLALAGYAAFGGAAPLAWRAGSWAVPYLAGLAAITFAGSYGGGRGLLDGGWDVAAVAAWSVVIFCWALRTRLAPETVRDKISEPAAVRS